jgi:hypothetical protein
MKRFAGMFSLLALLASVALAQSNSLSSERPYEPVILPAYSANLTAVNGVPVSELYLYAYEQGGQTWRMMPFQIDEQTYGPNPLTPASKKWMYFIPEFWSVDSINIKNHDGLFGDHDELVFLVRDMGDKAPERAFIDNDEAKKHSKIELVIYEADNPDKKGYAYIFWSSTITDQVPTPYNMQYLAAEDYISTAYYGLGLNDKGTVDDITIKEPGGNGKDILDRLKVRFGGVIDVFNPVDMVLTENDLYLFPEKQVTPKPVVRLIRDASMTLQFIGIVADWIAFPVQAKFYPFSGMIKGGTSLAPEDLIFYYSGVEIFIILKNLRESWDYSADAKGMKFYNKYNNGLQIDGNADPFDKAVDIPINNWDLTTGQQGSLLKIGNFKEQKWGGVELYYYDYDDTRLTQGDQLVFLDSKDTGDSLSFGDNGVLFRNKPDQDSITIDLNYTVYFIPEKDLTQADGERMAHLIDLPVQCSSSVITGVSKDPSATVINFELGQNYPNPFNQSTVISFSLPFSDRVSLQIFDSNGRLVKTLANGSFAPGRYKISWNGEDAQNLPAPSGVYFYKIHAAQFEQVRKLVLVR